MKRTFIPTAHNAANFLQPNTSWFSSFLRTGHNKFWPPLANQYMTIPEQVGSGIVLFIDCYPINTSLTSNIITLRHRTSTFAIPAYISLIIWKLLSTFCCFPCYHIDNIDIKRQDILIAHTVPLLGWSYLSDILQKIVNSIRYRPTVLILNGGEGIVGVEKDVWGSEDNFTTCVHKVITQFPDIVIINDLQTIDFNSTSDIVYVFINTINTQQSFFDNQIYTVEHSGFGSDRKKQNITNRKLGKIITKWINEHNANNDIQKQNVFVSSDFWTKENVAMVNNFN